MDNQNSAAARLIYRALNLSATPANDVEYRELLARYRASPELQQVLAEIAEGMELMVLDVSERGLIIAPARKESRFSIRLGDLRKNLSEDQRVALALSFLAICAVFYPTTALIEDDSRFPMPATLAMFRDTLTGLSGRIMRSKIPMIIPERSCDQAGATFTACRFRSPKPIARHPTRLKDWCAWHSTT